MTDNVDAKGSQALPHVVEASPDSRPFSFILRVEELLPVEPSFGALRSRLAREIRAAGQDDYFSNGPRNDAHILKKARRLGILSPMMDGNMVFNFRGDVYGTGSLSGPRDSKFIEQLSAKRAQEELDPGQKDALASIRRLEELARRYRGKGQSGVSIEDKDDSRLDQEEARIRAEYLKARYDFDSSQFKFPATRFLYLYENGGLGWLWGIAEDSTYDDVSNSTTAGRLGDNQWALDESGNSLW